MTKEDLQFDLPKLPNVQSSDIMVTPPPPPEPPPEAPEEEAPAPSE